MVTTSYMGAGAPFQMHTSIRKPVSVKNHLSRSTSNWRFTPCQTASAFRIDSIKDGHILFRAAGCLFAAASMQNLPMCLADSSCKSSRCSDAVSRNEDACQHVDICSWSMSFGLEAITMHPLLRCHAHQFPVPYNSVQCGMRPSFAASSLMSWKTHLDSLLISMGSRPVASGSCAAALCWPVRNVQAAKSWAMRRPQGVVLLAHVSLIG